MWHKYYINQTTLKILGLFRFNYNASFHLREISREVQVDAKAVRVQLKRLEEPNVIVSTQKGRNKEYSLNLDNYLTLYHLILAEAFASVEYLNRNFQIKKIVSETSDDLGNAALLFGSFAKGKTTQESDIDIIVVTDKKPNANVFQEVGKLIGREISIKFTTEEQFSRGLTNGDPLIREVAANHIILKGIDRICNIMWRYYARR